MNNKVSSTSTATALGILILLFPGGRGLADTSTSGSTNVPIIYSTDLYQPHEDPDDHYDLMTLFAIEEFNVLGIVLDHGTKQLHRPGRIPLAQMARLRGRNTPFAIGLKPPFQSLKDDGFAQPKAFQEGVDLIIEALHKSPSKVTVFTVGSLRDIAAAYNREPQLMKDKITRLYINLGNTSGNKNEWNVLLDEKAFACILKSDLPIYWCPCFGKLYGTYWQFKQNDVLAEAPAPIQNFFVFALATGQKWKGPIPAGINDPVSFLFRAVDAPTLKAVGQYKRNMWCTAPFLHAAGYQVVEQEPNRWIPQPPTKIKKTPSKIFNFVPVRLATYKGGLTTVEELPPSADSNLRIFKVLDQKHYSAAMADCLRELLRDFRLSPNNR
ncbi:MAG: nucleoside hydrolase [Planctomycetota bacterium]|nr:nucleoside hydrolase [Planctomycetota bacterium]